MLRLKRLPSPAMAVAFLALFLVLGGSAMALRGHNTVKGDDIKNGTITSGDVRNNTLTGSDVNESKLGAVPKATTAGKADSATTAGSAITAGSANTATTAASAGDSATVGGQSVRTYDLTVASNAAPATFSAGGVSLNATCTLGAANTAVRNVAGVAGAYQVNYVRTTGNTAVAFADEAFTSGDNDDMGSNASGSGTASASFADGTITTVMFAYQDAGQTGAGCHFWGRVISG